MVILRKHTRFKATWNALVKAKTSEGCASTNETTINTPPHTNQYKPKLKYHK